MNKVQLFIFLSISGFTLAACGSNKTDNAGDSSQSSSIVLTESSAESSNINSPSMDENSSDHSTEEEEEGLADLETNLQEALKNNPEDIRWEDVHLNRRQFREFIEQMPEEFSEKTSDEAEDSFSIVRTEFRNEDTIEIVISHSGSGEYTELAEGFFSLIMDSMVRQLYLHSDYSDGKGHPTVIISDSEGNILSEASNFIELEEDTKD